MAEVLLFHHAQGRTAGVDAFADELRRAGHTAHAPDLYDGRTFATLKEGMTYADLYRPVIRSVSGLTVELLQIIDVIPQAIVVRRVLRPDPSVAVASAGGRAASEGGPLSRWS